MIGTSPENNRVGLTLVVEVQFLRTSHPPPVADTALRTLIMRPRESRHLVSQATDELFLGIDVSQDENPQRSPQAFCKHGHISAPTLRWTPNLGSICLGPACYNWLVKLAFPNQP